jgi:hypothetical protein
MVMLPGFPFPLCKIRIATNWRPRPDAMCFSGRWWGRPPELPRASSIQLLTINMVDWIGSVRDKITSQDDSTEVKSKFGTTSKHWERVIYTTVSMAIYFLFMKIHPFPAPEMIPWLTNSFFSLELRQLDYKASLNWRVDLKRNSSTSKRFCFYKYVTTSSQLTIPTTATSYPPTSSTSASASAPTPAS